MEQALSESYPDRAGSIPGSMLTPPQGLFDRARGATAATPS